MAFYVQRQEEGIPLETVDEADTRKEAADMAKEYRLGDPSAIYYVSNCACKAWVNS